MQDHGFLMEKSSTLLSGGVRIYVLWSPILCVAKRVVVVKQVSNKALSIFSLTGFSY